MAHGAGGTSGGVGRFLIGSAMIYLGLYLMLQSVTVTSGFGLGMVLFGISALGPYFGITSGMIMVPFSFGVAMIFYNAKMIAGWALAIGSLLALIYGVIVSTHFMLRTMTAFDLILILVLLFGGIGLFLSSLRPLDGPSSASSGDTSRSVEQ